MPITPQLDDVLMMLPPPRFLSSGIAAFEQYIIPNRLIRMICSNISTSITSSAASFVPQNTDALLYSTSIPPYFFPISPNTACTCSQSAISSSKNSAFPPAAQISSSAFLPLSLSRSRISTVAPSFANSSAAALPIPLPPPVMAVTFPDSLISLFSLPYRIAAVRYYVGSRHII